MLVEHRQQTRGSVVVQETIELRHIPQPLLERVPRHGVPQRARNLVVGERIADGGGTDGSRRTGIVDLAEAHRPAERIRADDRARARVTRVARIEQA